MFIERLSRLAAAAALLLLAPAAHALPKVFLHPVTLVGYAGEAIRITVDLPCGGVFYGLVAEPEGERLTVAAAVAYDNIICTSFSQRTEFAVNYLATKAFKTIAPMTVRTGSRLLIAPISDLRLVKGAGSGAGAAGLTAVYEPRCGKTVGTLIHPAGTSHLELAVAEEARSMPVGECNAGSRTRVIKALNPAVARKVSKLRPGPRSLGRVFRLRMAEIDRSSVRIDRHGGMRFTYQRACNEAPVGVTLSQPGRKDGQVAVEIGMLVAKYDNFPCGDGVESTAFADSALRLPRGARIFVAKPSGGEGALAEDALALQSPTAMTWRQPLKTGARVLEVRHLRACHEVSRVVWARDARGALAVGIMVRPHSSERLAANSCKNQSSEVSLLQPYVARELRGGQIASLRIKGSLAH